MTEKILEIYDYEALYDDDFKRYTVHVVKSREACAKIYVVKCHTKLTKMIRSDKFFFFFLVKIAINRRGAKSFWTCFRPRDPFTLISQPLSNFLSCILHCIDAFLTIWGTEHSITWSVHHICCIWFCTTTCYWYPCYQPCPCHYHCYCCCCAVFVAVVATTISEKSSFSKRLTVQRMQRRWGLKGMGVSEQHSFMPPVREMSCIELTTQIWGVLHAGDTPLVCCDIWSVHWTIINIDTL